MRLGGDEMALFLVGRSAGEVVQVAERLRGQIEKMALSWLAPEESVTVSVARREPKEALDDLLRRTDAALYRAKDGGRNRVCSAD